MRFRGKEQRRKISGGPLVILPVIFLVAAFIAACSGGSSFLGGGIGGTAGVSQGVITGFGSIIVGSKELQKKSSSEVEIDDVSGLDESDLKLGMVVKVRGTFDDDGVNGDYDKVEAENELQGEVTGFGPAPNEFTALSQSVFVDGTTVYENLTDINGDSTVDIEDLKLVSPPIVVEVHGFRDDPLNNGTIRATRVELLTGPRLAEDDELKGFVSGLSGTAFFLGTQYVESGGAIISPAGANSSDIQNGVLVEVHGNIIGIHPTNGPIFVASKVDIEDLEDAEFEPNEDEDFEVEGFVTGFTDLASDFFVNGTRVRLDTSVSYEGGIATDLANGIRIEADGHAFNDPVDGLLLLAEEIEFKDSIRMDASAASVTAATATEATVFNTPVLIVAGITDDSGYTADPSMGLRIRGFLNADGKITATRIEDSSVSAGNEELQGPVKSPSLATDSFSIIGITIDTSSLSDTPLASSDFQDDDDNSLSRAAFYGQLVVDKTVVKARGTFSASPDTISANRVEIE